MPSLANAGTNESFGLTADIDVGTTTKGHTHTQRDTQIHAYRTKAQSE